MNRAVDTIIIGAGAAGLMAGLRLVQAGQHVILFEARDRVGGRILTRHSDAPLELGAEFIHGLPAVTWTLLRDAGISPVELSGTPYRYQQLSLKSADDEPATAFDVLDSMCEWYAKQPPGTDLSFENYLERQRITGLAAERSRLYVEGFNAANRSLIGVAALARQQVAENTIHTERMFHVPGGYDTLPRLLAEAFIAAGGEVRLSDPVRQVDWHQHGVRVTRESSATPVAARRLVVTLPLGVLKADTVRFVPDLHHMRDASDGLEMGSVLRLSFLFETAFWERHAPGMLFLFSPDDLVPTWWTAHPTRSPQITGWIGGASAVARAGSLRGDALLVAALEQLARVFRRPLSSIRSQVVASVTHDWTADPWAMGAYSYATAGGIDASARLATAIDSTLYFAGEHTDTEGHWGTVHAALASGERVAREILMSA